MNDIHQANHLKYLHLLRGRAHTFNPSEAWLIYTASSRTARATRRNCVMRKIKRKRKEPTLHPYSNDATTSYHILDLYFVSLSTPTIHSMNNLIKQNHDSTRFEFLEIFKNKLWFKNGQMKGNLVFFKKGKHLQALNNRHIREFSVCTCLEPLSQNVSYYFPKIPYFPLQLKINFQHSCE